ncbi:MAG: FadR family transcriptional regulator [Glaciihabitans sp.]|nr:FadR family transcriptional regulator [Glaciihabitans sp.]
MTPPLPLPSSTSAVAASTGASGTDRAWETVLRRIETDLLEGTLTPGDHLASERSLATELGVGRSSVREALRVLEVLGLIRTQSGSGPQSGAIIVARPSGGMAALMRLQVAAQGFAVVDVVKTRLVLEAAVVAELAGAGATPDLRTAEELLTAMDAGGVVDVGSAEDAGGVAPESPGALGPEQFLALDAAFHLSLAVASGNEVIASMMSGLRTSVESYVLAGVSAIPSWQQTSARLRAEHHHILAAIADHDPETAKARVHDHIAGYYAETNFPNTRAGF